jgi:hypothetical protein
MKSSNVRAISLLSLVVAACGGGASERISHTWQADTGLRCADVAGIEVRVDGRVLRLRRVGGRDAKARAALGYKPRRQNQPREGQVLALSGGRRGGSHEPPLKAILQRLHSHRTAERSRP